MSDHVERPARVRVRSVGAERHSSRVHCALHRPYPTTPPPTPCPDPDPPAAAAINAAAAAPAESANLKTGGADVPLKLSLVFDDQPGNEPQPSNGKLLVVEGKGGAVIKNGRAEVKVKVMVSIRRGARVAPLPPPPLAGPPQPLTSSPPRPLTHSTPHRPPPPATLGRLDEL